MIQPWNIQKTATTKTQTADIRNNLNESPGNYTEWKKIPKGILNDSIHITV